MNAITIKSSISGPPVPASREFHDRLSAITNRIGYFGNIPKLIDCEVGPKTRGELRARLEILDASLAHRDATMLTVSLTQVFAMTKVSSEDSADDLVMIYAAHLGNLPTWAVVSACRQIAQGRGESAIFSPAAPEIYLRAQGLLTGILRERKQITDILEASKEATPTMICDANEAEYRKRKVDEALRDFVAKATA